MKKQEKDKEQQSDARPVFDRPDGNHYAGSGHGCIKKGNAIYLSPGRKQMLEEISADRAGVQVFVAQTHEFLTKRLAQIERRQKHWWDLVQEDLGIPQGHPYAERLFTSRDGVITLAAEIQPGPEKK